MGLDQSKPLVQWDVTEVAAEVRKLGRQYHPYAAAVVDNGVDGAFLVALNPSEVEETMEDLAISSRLHRRVLQKKLMARVGGPGAIDNDTDAVTCGGSLSVLAFDAAMTASISDMAQSSSTLLRQKSIGSSGSSSPSGRRGSTNSRRGSVNSSANRIRRRSSTRLELAEDKTEVLAIMATCMDDEQSEQEALHRRQQSLQLQIASLVGQTV